MAGWYAPHGLYRPEELEGLSVSRFTEAVRAEGVDMCEPGCNSPLYKHSLFRDCDVYGHGKPTRIANSEQDVREFDRNFAVSEKLGTMIYCIPWFKHYRPEIIIQYADAYRKAAENYKELLEGDGGNSSHLGGWSFFNHK